MLKHAIPEWEMMNCCLKLSGDLSVYGKFGIEHTKTFMQKWYSPCCLCRAKMGQIQTFLVVFLHFFASWYASHRIRRRLTLLKCLILRRLPIIPRLYLFAHLPLPRPHEGRCLYLNPAFSDCITTLCSLVNAVL